MARTEEENVEIAASGEGERNHEGPSNEIKKWISWKRNQEETHQSKSSVNNRPGEV